MARVTTLSNRARPRWQLAVSPLALLLLIACGSSDDGGTGGASNVATGGSLAFGGTSGVGTSTGGRVGSSTGGVFVTGGVLSTGGVSSTGGFSTGGSSSAQGGKIGSAGATAQAGIGGIPGAGPDGNSPYQRECHGETAMCVDVASLRCLGIRDGMNVAGYSCSNPCQTNADCSKVPSSAEAAPACVDFVTQKHCLLLCLQQGKSSSCPTGMSCYVYPGSTTGYCLWP